MAIHRRPAARLVPHGLIVLLAAVCLLLAPASVGPAALPAGAAPPGAAPAKLSLTADVDRTRTVRVTGSLRTPTDQPLPSTQISLSIDDTSTGSARTSSTGTWAASFTVPHTITAGKHTLTATFDGARGVGATRASVPLDVPGEATTITATVTPTAAEPGAQLTVTGRVALSDRSGVSAGQVVVSPGDSSEADVTTLTDAKGLFVVRVQVPADARVGALPMTLSLEDPRYLSSSLELSVNVTATSSPATAAPATSESTTPDATASTDGGDGTISTISATPAPTPARSVLESFGGAKPLLILAAAVGVLVLGVVIGALRRRRPRSRSHVDRQHHDDGNSLFDD